MRALPGMPAVLLSGYWRQVELQSKDRGDIMTTALVRIVSERSEGSINLKNTGQQREMVSGSRADLSRRRSCWRSGDLPQGADRQGAEFVAERQRGASGVEDDTGDEVVAEAIGESA